jgi:hypothetical protein
MNINSKSIKYFKKNWKKERNNWVAPSLLTHKHSEVAGVSQRKKIER